jgi:hypothetical protein
MLFHKTVSSSQICTKEQLVGEKAICRPVHGVVSCSPPMLSLGDQAYMASLP